MKTMVKTVEDRAPAVSGNPVNWKIAIVEDHSGFRDELSQMLSDDAENQIEAFRSAEEFLSSPARGTFDLLLIDMLLPNLSGLDCIAQIVAAGETPAIIVLTSINSEENIFRALTLGATGFILKSEMENLPGLIRIVKDGGAVMSPTIALRVAKSFQKTPGAESLANTLTRREKQILDELIRGITEKEAAERFHLSVHTIRTHVKNIYSKLAVSSRVGMMRKAQEIGLL